MILFTFISLSSASAASKYPDAEEQIFALQKWWIRDIRSTLDIDLIQWVKQSGTMSLKTKINTSEASGSVNLQVEEYQTMYDAKTKNIEVSYRGVMEFEIHGSDLDYDSYNEETYNYKKMPYGFYATVNFDAKAIIMADGSAYLKLSRLDGRSHGNGTMKQWFDLALISLQEYVGTMYKIPWSTRSVWDIDTLLTQNSIMRALDILEQKPLLRVISKTGDVYALSPNRDTIKSLGWKMPKKATDIITYTKTADAWVIRISDKKNSKNNYITLTDRNGARTLDVNVKTISKKNGRLDMNISLAKHTFFMDIRDKSMTFLFDWKKDKLDMLIKNKARNSYDSSSSFELAIRWDLAFDGSNTKLIIVWDGNNVGSLTGKKVWNTGEYTLNMNIVSPMVNFLIDISGKYINERWDYQVLPPTIYKLFKNI